MDTETPPVVGAGPLRFLDLARLGLNGWWRYAMSYMFIVGGWVIFTIAIGIALMAYAAADTSSGSRYDESTGAIVGAPLAWFISMMISLILPLIGGLFISIRVIHQRSFRSLITPYQRIDWGRYLFSLVLFFALTAFGATVESLIYPDRYTLTFNAAEFLRFLPFILLLIPLQTSAEELFFRGYMMQSLGRLTRRAAVPVIVSSLFFMLVHLGNPEMSAGPIQLATSYFAIGLLLALVTVRDNRLEFALGAHAGNNLMSALGASYTTSALDTPAIFTVGVLDPNYALVSLLIVGLVFYAGCDWWRKRHASSGAFGLPPQSGGQDPLQ